MKILDTLKDIKAFFNFSRLVSLMALLIGLVSLPMVVRLAQERQIVQKKAAGNVYYVPDKFSSIQAAVNAAQPGDTIMVHSGTYNESVSFRTSGQEGSPITLTNHESEEVTINGGDSSTIVDNTGTEYWIIEGFNLDSNAEHTISFDAWGCDGTCGGTNHWIIRNNYIIGAVKIYGSYNLFEGNEVDGSQHKGAEDGVWELYDVSHHNVYRNNHIHHFNSRGIWSMHRTHDDIFENNHVYNIGSQCINTDGFGNVEWRHIIRGNHLHNCGSGIEMENTFASIAENNKIHDNIELGIDVINYGPHIPAPGTDRCQVGGESNQYGDTNNDNSCEGDITRNIIRQNLIYNSGSKAGIISYWAGGIKILGNTIHGGSKWAVDLEGRTYTPQIELRSNIFSQHTEAEISVDDNNYTPLTVDDHNLFYNSNPNIMYETRSDWKYLSLPQYQTTGKGQGSLFANPQFVNPTSADFHLFSSSGAINKGIDIGLTEDLDGNPRPQGAGYDIGVYEYSGGVQPTPFPTPTSTPIPPSPTPKPTSTSTPTPTPRPTPTVWPYLPTPTPTPTPVLSRVSYVNIEMSKLSLWKWWKVTANVRITEWGIPMNGAILKGHWSGAQIGNVSGKTNKQGKVSFKTGWMRTGNMVWFTVDQVTKEGQDFILTGELTDSIYR